MCTHTYHADVRVQAKQALSPLPPAVEGLPPKPELERLFVVSNLVKNSKPRA